MVGVYGDKEVKKNVKDIFDIYVTEYGTALTTVTYFVPVFKYCYSDSRNL